MARVGLYRKDWNGGTAQGRYAPTWAGSFSASLNITGTGVATLTAASSNVASTNLFVLGGTSTATLAASTSILTVYDCSLESPCESPLAMDGAATVTLGGASRMSAALVLAAAGEATFTASTRRRVRPTGGAKRPPHHTLEAELLAMSLAMGDAFDRMASGEVLEAMRVELKKRTLN